MTNYIIIIIIMDDAFLKIASCLYRTGLMSESYWYGTHDESILQPEPFMHLTIISIHVTGTKDFTTTVVPASTVTYLVTGRVRLTVNVG